MGKIVISENVTLDGIVEDPSGEEGFEHGGWVGHIGDRPAVARAALADALGAEAILFGRGGYEFFGARWPSRSGELADRLNGLPKFVVSSTLEAPDWSNSTVLNGEPVDAVSKLKREVDGEILLIGSIRLARTLIEHGLADELRLAVFPVALGAGERLFDEIGGRKQMRLAGVETGDGIAFLTYEAD